MKVLFVCLAILVLGILFAPGFLVYSHPLDKADCIIVMVGSDQRKRNQGGEELLKEGRGEALLIPAYRQVAFAEGSGIGKRERVGVTSGIKTRRTIFGHSFRVVENSHLEMMLGKKMMDKLGFHSAVIVSSPYHMRRLKLIAGKVFGGGKYRIGFEPTPFEKQGTFDLPRSWKDFENVATEYLKIGWFLVYSMFVSD
jgi:uncharacterized SAM-binding protein YcdF (DUF218 family)